MTNDYLCNIFSSISIGTFFLLFYVLLVCRLVIWFTVNYRCKRPCRKEALTSGWVVNSFCFKNKDKSKCCSMYECRNFSQTTIIKTITNQSKVSALPARCENVIFYSIELIRDLTFYLPEKKLQYLQTLGLQQAQVLMEMKHRLFSKTKYNLFS